MFIVALLLLMVGAVTALMGFKLFRLILPLVGLVAGTVVGFTGFQGVFGKGAVSTTVAVFVAVIVGLMMGLLSYMFFNLAVAVFMGIVGASALSFLGIAIGLNENGFVVFMLAVTGFIIGITYASATPMSASLVITMTSLVGVALILSGIFLVAGSVSLQDLNEGGIIASVLRVVDQSFLWLFVWLGGSIIAMQAQIKTVANDMLGSDYQYKD